MIYDDMEMSLKFYLQMRPDFGQWSSQRSKSKSRCRIAESKVASINRIEAITMYTRIGKTKHGVN